MGRECGWPDSQLRILFGNEQVGGGATGSHDHIGYGGVEPDTLQEHHYFGNGERGGGIYSRPKATNSIQMSPSFAASGFSFSALKSNAINGAVNGFGSSALKFTIGSGFDKSFFGAENQLTAGDLLIQGTISTLGNTAGSTISDASLSKFKPFWKSYTPNMMTNQISSMFQKITEPTEDKSGAGQKKTN